MPATGTTKQPPRGLKIVSDENIVTNAKIYALIDGQELDISSIVQKVDVKLHINELATANLQMIVYSVETKALLDQADINEYRPRRFSRLWGRVREVTSFASRDGICEYLR